MLGCGAHKIARWSVVSREVQRGCGILLWWWGGLRLFVFIILAAAEDFLKEVLLFGLGGGLGGVGGVAVGWGVGGLANDRGASGAWRRGGIRCGGFVATDAEDLLDEV